MSTKRIHAGLKSETYDTVRIQLDQNLALMKKFGYLSALIDCLDYRAKHSQLTTIKDRRIKAVFHLYIITHNIVRWKRSLAYLVPDLYREIPLIERCYRIYCYTALMICDRLHTFDKESAVIAGVLAFDEIKHLTKMEMPDTSAVDHVQLALKARLKVLCSRIFDFDSSTIKKEYSVGLMKTINPVSELSFCLPPACRDYADFPREPFLPLHLPATPLDLSSCLLRRSDSSDDYCNDRQTDSCCCGWAFDSTPNGFLFWLGHSDRTFARYFHSGPRKTSLGDEDSAFDTSQAINAIFGGPWGDDSSLFFTMAIFGSILSCLLLRLCEVIDFVEKELKTDPERADVKGRLDRNAGLPRPQFFAHLLRSAVDIYHGFCDSDRESETDDKSPDKVWIRVYDWVLKRQHSESHEFVCGVLKILGI